MNFFQLSQKAKTYPIFKTADVLKWFPRAKKASVLRQLTLWVKKGYVERLRKDLYILADYEIADSRILSNLLYNPSYISLETALNSYSIIPDIPFATTVVTLQKTKTFRTRRYGTFLYHHVAPKLFFGFQTVPSEKGYSYSIALPEKALFDYFYLKGRDAGDPYGFVEELRLSVPESFSFQNMRSWQKLVPHTAKKVHQVLEAFLKHYDQ